MSNIKHGHAGQRSTEYSIHQGVKTRTTNPNIKGWGDYGGRGIRMCNRWRYGENGKSGFECFLQDMGPRPSLQHSLDRIDVNGHYEPGNCRWATQREQVNNMRRNRRVTIGHRAMTLTEISSETGLSIQLLSLRFKKGWPPERLASPARKYTRSKTSR